MSGPIERSIDDQDDRHALAQAFDATASAYELGRPEYPDEALSFWDEHGAFERGHTVLDLAAGTGKLTRLLPILCDVRAVEPQAAMREQYAAAVPDRAVVSGTAEDIPFDDDTFDVVLVAQAFHWFDQVAVLDAHRSFGATVTFECRWEDETTVDGVLADVLSRSYVSILPPDERLAVLRRTREALERHLGADVGRVAYPYRTTAFWTPLAATG